MTGVRTGSLDTRVTRGDVRPYALPARPLPVGTSAAPIVDLRDRFRAPLEVLDSPGTAWDGALAYLDLATAALADDRERAVRRDTIKAYDRGRGADHDELERVLDALGHGHLVAFYGWWPTAESAGTSEILGIDAMEVPPPDRKGVGLVDGHAVVIVGYGRHAAFPGGGYVIVRNGWSANGWGDPAGDGAMPFTYLRAYATELSTCRLDDGPARPRGSEGPSSSDRPAAGTPRLPDVAPRDLVDVEVDQKARCSDGRGTHTHLFFSDEPLELARARAICASCPVRALCLARALARGEPYGIWGGELVVNGVVVADKRGRGRPRKVPRPRLVVDEVTGVPIAV